MTAPLLVLVAHGLDGLTLLMAVEVWGFSGESNPFAQAAYAFGGLGAVLLLKAGGAAVLAWIVAHARLARTTKLLFAAAAGVVGATVNLISVWIA